MEKLDFIDSKFRFAILAAKRAKQLVSGAKKKVAAGLENPLTIAMEEISQGKIKFRVLEDNDMSPMEKEENTSIFMGHADEEDEDNHNHLEELLYTNDDDAEDNDEEDF